LGNSKFTIQLKAAEVQDGGWIVGEVEGAMWYWKSAIHSSNAGNANKCFFLLATHPNGIM